MLVLVHLIAAAHIAHWATTGSSLSPVEPSEAKEFAERSLINAGFVFFALMIGSTLIFGRWFCGWACHLVALQDLCRSLMLKIGITPRPLRSRALALVPFVAAGYLYFWPLIQRQLLDVGPIPTRSEYVVDDFWATFPGPIVAVLTFLVCGFACVYFLGAKGFCTYACPYGAFFGVADKFAPGAHPGHEMRARAAGTARGVCSSNVGRGARGARPQDGHRHRLHEVHGLRVGVPQGRLVTSGLDRRFSSEKRKPKPRPLSSGEELVLALTGFLSFLAVYRLYGGVPFLFALGLAGVCAFLLLRFVQLFTKQKVKLLSTELKHAGERTPAGTRFLLLGGVLIGLLVHSGYVQWQWPARQARIPGRGYRTGQLVRA